LYASRRIHPRLQLLSIAVLAAIAPAFANAPYAHAIADPNQYSCFGHIAGGTPEPGNTEQQVAYTFFCNGDITGYQLESQLPLTGFESAPLVSDAQGPVTDTFSCNGEFPGYAVNCVGATKAPEETITGQFAIGSKLCTEPREDPLLTVTYAYIEKGVVTQAISGPFDLGRPHGCPPSPLGGTSRLTANPVKEAQAKDEKSKAKQSAKGKRSSEKKKKKKKKKKGASKK
jgi:hypothetical protein